ncbi:bifunctional metallophosphatase/5'-nucleotidase [Dermatophilus congolensis]|uniref:bifunctional metallophosphatase/5'-nucleotidase n=1 Tax=Dermatophilus congolensis TaxID=1863 RepID=UPI001AAFDEEF|nr:bifunctional metallophosphatase/5'-nucleotidase [Dermatophilus congolensis]MBO3143740.1 bifunctional metallophosphatase/5'-nucleotidase [Dermatophilus congolensis]MBO3152731.1 bifunctional metallophosphatase/5'-nucleotidase [Dermatophilus congolensis]MBO3160258.1 bifunctional metallophosphatase/5'-nucleotidase [Dermatophilus congolensis]MBO3164016.1 bifunctional metallophosphatase/5'-nucleotidase [Dermatophilus congolensis]MBO3177561.1 bifunctional metallophosphatase/5'-nucleotidase [Dermat
MTHSRSRAALACGIATVAVLALSPAGYAAAATSTQPALTASPDAPEKDTNGMRKVQILGINDFHGALEPPAGSGGVVTDAQGKKIPAGGVEYLSTHLQKARQKAAASGAGSITVSAGDNIGGSPFLSQAFHDEPTIEALNRIGLSVAAVGNHELDHGWTELRRIANGGCFKDKKDSNKASCALHTFEGAKFDYVAANIKDKEGKNLAPFAIRKVNGAPVAFIGLTLKGAPDIVSQSGVRSLTFEDEVAAGNRTAAFLKKKGVNAMVALVHQGGNVPAKSPWNYHCKDGKSLTGDITPIARNLSADIDLIMSSHTHESYTCSVLDPAGKPRLVTQAGHYGRLFAQVDATYNPSTKDFVRETMRASNHVVTRDVAKDPAMTALISAYTGKVKTIANKKVGTITGDVTADRDATGSTPLGNLIADAFRSEPSAATNGKAPQIAFMNPGGIRADLTHASSPAGEGKGVVTYKEAFSVQPFGNNIVSLDLTGAQIYEILDQQWSGSEAKILQVSNGFTYEYRAEGSGKGKVIPNSVKLNGTPINRAATYRVVTNSFLADGGDGFTTFSKGTKRHQGGLDIDSFTRYLGAHQPYSPVTTQRVTRR